MYAMIADPDGRVREPVGAWRDLTVFPKHLARNVVKIIRDFQIFTNIQEI